MGYLAFLYNYKTAISIGQNAYCLFLKEIKFTYADTSSYLPKLCTGNISIFYRELKNGSHKNYLGIPQKCITKALALWLQQAFD